MAKRRVIIAGGGFAGCAAAIASAKAGVKTVLMERADMLLAGGNRAGRMNYNGKMAAAEEAKALGGGEVFEALETIILHRSGLAGEDHGYTYDCSLAEPVLRRLLRDFGVKVLMERRVTDAVTVDNRLVSVVLDRFPPQGQPGKRTKVSFGERRRCTGPYAQKPDRLFKIRENRQRRS